MPLPFTVEGTTLFTLAGVEYGSVEIIIQDSKVVQIERTQRSRFSQPLEIPRV